jgi:hypothetical protein
LRGHHLSHAGSASATSCAHPHRARQGLRRPARLAIDAADLTTGGLLAAVSAVRGGKAVHPDGVSYRARLAIDGAAHAPAASELLSTPAERPAIVRVSRSLGLPRPWSRCCRRASTRCARRVPYRGSTVEAT